jgi:WD40 repeat protein
MSCQFSEKLEHTGGNVCFSPSSSLIASASGARLTVRDAQTLEVSNIYPCVDKIDKVEFSPDSEYISAAIYSRNAVQVFSVKDPEWTCRVNEGVAGLVSSRWTPDSRHIVTESDFAIQLTVWSLVDSSSQIIHYPKQGAGKDIMAFSGCGKFMTVGHRIDLQDYIGVYATKPWAELSKFKCAKDSGNDLASLQWTPNSAHIVASDSHLMYKFAVYTPAGEVVAFYEAYQQALGLRQVVFHRGAQGTTPICPLVALGSYDGKVRLLSTTHWQTAFILNLTHPKNMVGGIGNDVITTVEVLSKESENTARSNSETVFTSKRMTSVQNSEKLLGDAYIVKPLKSLPTVKPTIDVSTKTVAAPPKMGVNYIAFSQDGSLLVAKDESHPRCLWVWSTLDAKLKALLVQLDNVSCCRWRPFHSGDTNTKPLLAFCCGSPRVYFWSEGGTSWVDLTYPMNVTALRWNDNGSQLILLARSGFCTCDVVFTDQE